MKISLRQLLIRNLKNSAARYIIRLADTKGINQSMWQEYGSELSAGSMINTEKNISKKIDILLRCVEILEKNDISKYKFEADYESNVGYLTFNIIPNHHIFIKSLVITDNDDKEEFVIDIDENEKIYGIEFLDLKQFKDVLINNGTYETNTLMNQQEFAKQRKENANKALDEDLKRKLSENDFGYLQETISKKKVIDDILLRWDKINKKENDDSLKSYTIRDEEFLKGISASYQEKKEKTIPSITTCMESNSIVDTREGNVEFKIDYELKTEAYDYDLGDDFGDENNILKHENEILKAENEILKRRLQAIREKINEYGDEDFCTLDYDESFYEDIIHVHEEIINVTLPIKVKYLSKRK